MPPAQALDNLAHLVHALLRLSRTTRKAFVERMHLTSTQGAGYHVALPEVDRLAAVAEQAEGAAESGSIDGKY